MIVFNYVYFGKVIKIVVVIYKLANYIMVILSK